MKKSSLLLLLTVFMVNCSSTQLVERWKNPDIDSYEPYKILVVGLTSDQDARFQFENKLKKELESRGSEAIMSLDVLKTDIMDSEDLDTLEHELLQEGYDTILLTKIVGVEDKVSYSEDYKGFSETFREFKEEYLKHQDVYSNPDYYNEYKVYKAETSMYCICPTKDRELIWKGYINITDPQSQSVEKTVTDFVRLVIVVLEEEQLIRPIQIKNQNTTSETVQ
ncbi:hypothetical protein [Psychroserpens mesophilus]|uniref:hypothetical protein n=1 Tax=Psychroserpens mesophilus TaxID=325473 RepID=UPI003D654A67